MKNKNEYLESLRALNRRVYILGEAVEHPNDHPIVAPSTEALAQSYAMAAEPEHQELFTARSHLSGESINRFTHVHQGRDDLLCKVDMLRAQGRRTATCFQRCAGLDGLNTMYSVTFEIDQKHGTRYHERFKKFLAGVQENDEVVAACMTDPKGDRRLRPAQQPDPDVYLRVVERRADGVVVQGAKCHITGALNAHYVLAIPTRRLRDDERDWAISFAVPADTPGVTFVLGRQASDTRKLEPDRGDVGNFKYGGHEALVIFDHVFVPDDAVFMNGETEATDKAISYFGSFHRASYGGCKSGMGDNLIGAASLVARANGTRQASHVQEKLAEMVQLNEVLYACGTAASLHGFALPSGGWCTDFLLSNVCKLNVTRNPYEIARLATDIAGGLMVTMPAAVDFEHEQIGELVQKYLRASEEYSVEHRRRLMRFLETTIHGTGGVCYLTESLHGAGSPQAQLMQIRAEGPFEQCEAAVTRLLDLQGEEEGSCHVSPRV